MTKKEINKEIKFTKEQIINCNKFNTIEKDILEALLEDKEYSLDEAKKIIEDFNKKEVK
ncbi:hypothetical protein KQI86_12935 [Clostridium sp. MSJ-11]|uniref:Uncharacterized protein n=1 Tax=Clostridium mobile TaxID=2841512 RepID=A0ABS6EJ56_9CLOT|nr:hypothetical protein [Clostridium mobile]MBU5485243.1 hypothetical protein [Clostridium mobile]